MKTCRRQHEYDSTLKQCPVCQKAAVAKRYAKVAKVKESKATYRAKNASKLNKYSAAYYAANKEEILKYHAKWRQARMTSDPLFKLQRALRPLIRNAIKRKGYTKTSRTQDILGADFNTVQTHLILTALNNYGMWLETEAYHIDHVIPVSSAKSEAELVQLNHYSNLQLLYPTDNLTKADQLNWALAKAS